jgi:hypothetical protein
MSAAVQKPTLTQEQKDFLAVVSALSQQEKAEVRLTSAGVVGLGLLTAAAYLIWSKR